MEGRQAGQRRIFIAAVPAVLGWAALFMRVSMGLPVPVTLPLVLAFAALLTSLFLPGVARRMLFVLALLVLVGSIAERKALAPPRSLENAWRERDSSLVEETLAEAARRIHALDELSSRVGREAGEFVLSRYREGSDRIGERIGYFKFLAALAERVQKNALLPRGMEMGLQLFDRSGKRIAWSGWPQPLAPAERAMMESGKESLFSRRSSLYRILTRIVPVKNRQGEPVAVLVVDFPIEADYKVNNKFIKGMSLAEALRNARVSEVSFRYYPVFEALRTPVKAMRPRGEEEGTAAYMSIHGGVGGEPASGMSGIAVVRSTLGTRLLDVNVRGFPFRHFMERYRARYSSIAESSAVLSFLLIFLFAFPRIPRREGPLGPLLGAAVLVAFIVALRYALLAFHTVSPGSGTKVFDPVIFATPLLGGIMRSAGDLFITALLACVAVYGVMKIFRNAQLDSSPRDPGLWASVLKGIACAGLITGFFELARRFIGTVVVNANPRLIGGTLNFSELHVVVLHASVFLMITAMAFAAVIAVWGVARLGGRGDASRVYGVASVSVIVALVAWGWVEAVMAVLILAFIVSAPRMVRREDLVSIVMASFYLVVVFSGLAYAFYHEEYQALRKIFIQEKAQELANPSDNWKAFIVEDVLDGMSRDMELRTFLREPSKEETSSLAFNIWAESPLSLLGYSCAIYVFDGADSLLSRFEVDMPFRVDFSEGNERIDAPAGSNKAVLDLERSTARGGVRFYRGILELEDFLEERGEGSGRIPIGKVMIDVPYFFENLAWAAITGPRTPEILRNVQEGGVEPRLEEPEALLLGRLRGSLVVESSSDFLPAGATIAAEKLREARGMKWPLLELEGATYRFMVSPSERPGITLLAGFKTPTPVWHVLRWATLLTLYLVFTIAIILAIILLRRVPALRPVMPSILPGRHLEFQQKLLASFLVVAVVPAIVLGVFSVRMVKERFAEENRKEAMAKAFNAKKALSNLLSEELEVAASSMDVSSILAGGQETIYRLPGGRIIVPVTGEELRDIGEAGDLFVRKMDDGYYIGIVSRPYVVDRDGIPVDLYLYYARALDTGLLQKTAEQVGADVNVYIGGRLAASSREGMIAGGFVRAIMAQSAYLKVTLLGSDHAITTERAGRYDYQVAYVPLGRWSGWEGAALSLPLLFQPESYNVEVEKATAVVLGVFALLFAATIGLGLVLARTIFEPLRLLLEATRRIAKGDLSFKLPMRRRDEIGTVMNAFNEMTEKLSESQTALEERRRYLETILANIGTGVVGTDADNRIRTMNAAARRILGIGREEVLGRSPVELAREGIMTEFFGMLDRHVRSKESFVSSETNLTREGKRRTIKYMVTRLGEGDDYVGSVLVFEDLTELISSKKLSAWVEMARQIAHEIKNPLTPIKLSAQFMKKAYDEGSSDFDRIFRESSDTIMQQVEVLRRIASEFSSFGRMQELELETQRLLPVVEKIVSPYCKNDSGVNVRLEVSKPDIEVTVDAEAVRRICTNLIENAMEAMQNGGELRVGIEEREIDGKRYACVYFEDTGPGLSGEVQERLFEPYFSTKTTGTGLGLAICRSLSREMGGDVTVENLPDGSGAVAALFLPLAGD